MSEQENDIGRLTPQKLLESFSRGKVIRCVILAVVIHAAVIGALSTRYIYCTWVNPEAGEASKEAEAREAAENANVAAVATPAPSGNVAAAAKAGGADESDAALVKKHGDRPSVKAITDTAAPDEIPKAPTPGGLGISLEDTN